MSENKPHDPITRLDAFIDAQPSLTAIDEAERTQLRAQITPLLAELDAVGHHREEVRGAEYYAALVENQKAYTKWRTIEQGTELEYERIWQKINDAYYRVTGTTYPGRKAKPEAEILDAIMTSSDHDADRLESDRNMLMHFAVGTERLRTNVTTPGELLTELAAYREDTLTKARAAHPEDDPVRALARSREIDVQLGVERTAVGVGRAALELGDFVNAGTAFGFARSIGYISAEDADLIYIKMQPATARDRATFADTYRKFSNDLPKSRLGTVAW